MRRAAETSDLMKGTPTSRLNSREMWSTEASTMPCSRMNCARRPTATRALRSAMARLGELAHLQRLRELGDVAAVAVVRLPRPAGRLGRRCADECVRAELLHEEGDGRGGALVFDREGPIEIE